jgi:type IV secretion system protein VirB5
MLEPHRRLLAMFLFVSFACIPIAQAQWAVVDSPAIAQLIQEVQTMQQQLAVARNQLQSAQQSLAAMTGDRGMEQLLSGTSRNYLPSTWAQVTSALQGQGTGAYAGLSTDVKNIVAVNAILTPQRLATLAPSDQQQIQTAREWGAMHEALAHEALANSSARFSALQGLIASISSAGDQKAALDLQARISAELAMLQNEQTKLQVFHQAMQAQDSAVREQVRESVIAGQGSFESRFKPVP